MMGEDLPAPSPMDLLNPITVPPPSMLLVCCSPDSYMSSRFHPSLQGDVRLLLHTEVLVSLAAMGAVDGVMTVSAAQALFYNQTALILSGLPNTTQYVAYPPMPKAGAVSQVRRLTSLFCTVLARSTPGPRAQCGRVGSASACYASGGALLVNKQCGPS